jgi:hypothetical protein
MNIRVAWLCPGALLKSELTAAINRVGQQSSQYGNQAVAQEH